MGQSISFTKKEVPYEEIIVGLTPDDGCPIIAPNINYQDRTSGEGPVGYMKISSVRLAYQIVC